NNNQPSAETQPWKPYSQGVVYRLIRDKQLQSEYSPQIAEANLKALRLRGLDGSADPRTRLLFIHDLAVHHNSLGTWYEEQGQFDSALKHYLLAASIAHWDEAFIFNAGNASYHK